MNIDHIIKIKHCASFVDFRSASELPSLSRFSLVFGWNGSGKATLSRIFRSFETQKNPFTAPDVLFEVKLADGTTITTVKRKSGLKATYGV